MTSDTAPVRADFTASSTTRRFEVPFVSGSFWAALPPDPRLSELMRLVSEGHLIPVPDLINTEPGAFMELRQGGRLMGLIPLHFAEAGSNEARTRQLIGRKMNQVWALEDGWRGPGTLVPSRAARDFYLSVVQVLPGRLLGAAQPTPTADGGLYMEWTRGNRERGDRDYSAEITSDGQLILTVLTADDGDDLDQIIAQPTTEDLADFICNGV